MSPGQVYQTSPTSNSIDSNRCCDQDLPFRPVGTLESIHSGAAHARWAVPAR